MTGFDGTGSCGATSLSGAGTYKILELAARRVRRVWRVAVTVFITSVELLRLRRQVQHRGLHLTGALCDECISLC